MLYLALGAAVLWLAMNVYRRAPGLQRGGWRVGAGLAGLAAIIPGAYLALRGQWLPGGALVVLGVGMALSARSARGAGTRPTSPPSSPGRLSEAEARSMLGVGPEAGREEIQAAYARLMRRVHPDHGGATGLAAQLNAARDRLLKG